MHLPDRKFSSRLIFNVKLTFLTKVSLVNGSFIALRQKVKKMMITSMELYLNFDWV